MSMEALRTLPVFSARNRTTPSLATDALLLLTFVGRTSLRGVKTHQSTRHQCTLGESLSPAWVGPSGQEQLRQGAQSQATPLEAVHP